MLLWTRLIWVGSLGRLGDISLLFFLGAAPFHGRLFLAGSVIEESIRAFPTHIRGVHIFHNMV